MRLVILGAGGHGKVVADIASQTGRYDEVLMLDDHAKVCRGKLSDYKNYIDNKTEMYPAFGDNKLRVEWEERLLKEGIHLARIIHPKAYVSPLARIENGCVIMPYAIINTGCFIKKACIINCGAIVDHDCILEEGCHVAPGGIVKGSNHLPKYIKVDSGEVIERSMYGK